MADSSDKSLMNSLGQFVGHVVRGIRTDPSVKTSTTEVRRTEEEEVRDGVVLRRTVIEEVVVPDPDRHPPGRSADPNQGS